MQDRAGMVRQAMALLREAGAVLVVSIDDEVDLSVTAYCDDEPVCQLHASYDPELALEQAYEVPVGLARYREMIGAPLSPPPSWVERAL